MSESELADTARLERLRRRLTQRDVADRLGVSTQAISKAENYTEGDSMTSLRERMIRELTDRPLAGPVWYFEDE